MTHKKYPKIRALGNAENEGILEGDIVIQEKIDGANLSIWKEGEGFCVGSRTQTVGTPEQVNGFRGAVEYVNKEINLSLFALFDELEKKFKTKDVRLFGEWLVAHTIGTYNIDAYNHFYLYDIEIDGENIHPVSTVELANKYNIKFPVIFERGENISEDKIKGYVGKSYLGPDGEGIVVKNSFFTNKFGDPAYAKIVGDKFREENAITFGGMQKGDNEMKIVLKYCTDGRVRKIINKIEQNEDKDIQMEDIKKIIGMVQHDIIVEEAWNYQKFGTVDFKRLKGFLGNRTAKIAIGIINGHPVSVAFDEESLSSK